MRLTFDLKLNLRFEQHSCVQNYRLDPEMQVIVIYAPPAMD